MTRADFRPSSLSRTSKTKLRFIMWVARRLGVPMQVHQSFFLRRPPKHL